MVKFIQINTTTYCKLTQIKTKENNGESYGEKSIYRTYEKQ